MPTFQKATKFSARLRLALVGPSGSGKTYTALTLACAIGNRVAVIDTERGSASKYADLFGFDVLNLETFSPLAYVEAIKAAEVEGYDVLVIDSLSHAWIGKDGALEQVDRAAKRSQSNNSYTAWRDVTPMHNALVDAILQSKCHVIATMRAKTEYVIETNERGKQVPRKVGMAPVQRDGLEYEFDVVADMNLENDFIVSKSRCPGLNGAVINKPSAALADTLKNWLTGATPATAPAEKKPEPSKKAPAPANGERPYSPEALRAAIAKGTEQKRGHKATDNQRKLVGSMLSLIFTGEDEQRHAVQAYLTGHRSVNEMTDEQILTLIKWIDPQPDGGNWYTPSALASREAVSAYAAAVEEAGQGRLV